MAPLTSQLCEVYLSGWDESKNGLQSSPVQLKYFSAEMASGTYSPPIAFQLLFLFPQCLHVY